MGYTKKFGYFVFTRTEWRDEPGRYLRTDTLVGIEELTMEDHVAKSKCWSLLFSIPAIRKRNTFWLQNSTTGDWEKIPEHPCSFK